MLLAFAGALGLEAAKDRRRHTRRPGRRARSAARESLTFLPEGNAFRGVVEDAVRSGMRDGLLRRLFGASGWGGVRPVRLTKVSHRTRSGHRPQPPPAPPWDPRPSAPRWAEGDDPEGGDIDMAAAVLLGEAAELVSAVPVGRLIEIVGPRQAGPPSRRCGSRSPGTLAGSTSAMAPILTAAVGLVRDAVGELRDRAPAPGREAGRGGDRATGQQDGRLADRARVGARRPAARPAFLLLGDHADLAAAHDIHERLLAHRDGPGDHRVRSARPVLDPGRRSDSPSADRALFLQDRPAPASFRAELLAAAGRTVLLRARARPADSAHDGGERTAAVARLRAAADLLRQVTPDHRRARGDPGLGRTDAWARTGDEATLRDAVIDAVAARGVSAGQRPPVGAAAPRRRCAARARPAHRRRFAPGRGDRAARGAPPRPRTTGSTAAGPAVSTVSGSCWSPVIFVRATATTCGAPSAC